MSDSMVFAPNDIVEGSVIKVTKDEIEVMVGMTHGVINVSHVSKKPKERNTAGFKPGDKVRALVVSAGGGQDKAVDSRASKAAGTRSAEREGGRGKNRV